MLQLGKSFRMVLIPGSIKAQRYDCVCRLLLALSLSGLLVGCSADQDEAGSEVSQQYGDLFWAEQAQSFEAFVPEPGIGAAYAEEDWIDVGRWGPIIDWPQIAVGAANRPDGRIMTWSAEFPDSFGSKLERNIASVFDPVSGEFQDADFNGHNMFCAGVAMLPDGDVLLAGGGQTVSETSVFRDQAFLREEKMHLSRWYPTSTMLPSGQVLTSLGTKTAPWSEIWTKDQGWHLLDTVSLDFILDENEGVNVRDWYPALSVTPNGTLFHSGPMTELFSIDLHANEPISRHGPRVNGEGDRLYGITVMYDVGKLLIAGGGQNNSRNTAMTVDVNGTTPIVRATSSMQHKRSMQNSLVLPNGEVLVIGGNTSGQQFSDSGTVLEPEIWNPVTEQWRPVAPHQEPRNYHSTALLLQDATVISMGGGLCGGCLTNHQNGEIYEPPYLFDSIGEYAARPEITDGPESAIPGEAVTLHGSENIVAFNMVRLIAMTHHHSTDQRFVPLDFTDSESGQYNVEIYSNPNVVVPGYYWIFGLNQSGVPSVGHLIKIDIAAENLPPTIQTGDRVEFEYYEGFWSKIPDFDSLVPLKTGFQSDFSLRERQRISNYAFRFRGTLSVPSDGQYQFYLASDDGSRILVNGNVVVDHDGKHPFTSEKEGNPVFLDAGTHDIEVEFFEADGGDALLASWSGPGFDKRPITETDLGQSNSFALLPEEFVEFSSTENSFLSYRYYEGDWTQLPNFEALEPVAEGQVSSFSLENRKRDNLYGFQFDGFLEIPVNGEYTFFLKSDDGSKLYINDVEVVDNDGTHAAWFEVPGQVALNAGVHSITVEFFERTGLDSLQVMWQGPGVGKQELTTDALIAVDSSTDNIDQQISGIEASIPTEGEVAYEYYEGEWTELPSFELLNAIDTGTQFDFSLSGKRVDDFYGYRFAAYIDIVKTGEYTFYLQSDDGSRLEVDGDLIVDNDGLHPLTEVQGSLTLSEGRHHLLVEYFERTGGDGLIVSWSGPDIPRQSIPGAVLHSAPFVFTPEAPLDDEKVIYELFDGNWTQLPDFDSLTPLSVGQTDDFSLLPAGDMTHFGLRYTGQLQIDTPGNYTFYTSSNDGSQIVIDEQLVVDNDGKHGLVLEQGQVVLSAGTHDFELRYFQSGGGKGLSVMWAGPGFQQRTLPPGVTFAPAAHIDLASSPLTPAPVVDSPANLPDSATPDTPDTPVSQPVQTGVEYSYYEGQWNFLPDFDSLIATEVGTSENFELINEGLSSHYGIRFIGTIEVAVAGDYQFFVTSNDGSRLFIDDVLVVDNDGKHGAVEVEGLVSLDAGQHLIELQYFQSGGSELLSVQWEGPGFTRQDIDDALLSGM